MEHKRPNYASASTLIKRQPRTPRTCLLCGKTFASLGPQNRQCKRCSEQKVAAGLPTVRRYSR